MKNKNHDESTKERIISAAVSLFCHKGFEATSVREIVKAAGVTKPVLYYYFKNKKDLFHIIIESSLTPFHENLINMCGWTEGNFQDPLHNIAELYIKASEETPDRVRFIHAIAFSGLYNDIFDFTEYWHSIFEYVVGLFVRGQERGFVRNDFPPDIMARYFLGMCESAMRAIAYCPEKLDEYPSSEVIVNIIMKGIQR
jgi:AcrR family transcriptional regulator